MDIRGIVDNRNFMIFGAIILVGVSLSVGILIDQAYQPNTSLKERVVSDGDATVFRYYPPNGTSSYVVTYELDNGDEPLLVTVDEERIHNVSRDSPLEIQANATEGPLDFKITIKSLYGQTLHEADYRIERE